MQKTSLICNSFSGINRSNSVFSSSVITASDIQNVELFSTETNSGVGIRTANGNISVCDLIPEDEIVINIFESRVIFLLILKAIVRAKFIYFRL